MNIEKNLIPLSVPNLSADIVPLIESIIESGWISTGGDYISEFEDKVAKYINIDNAVAVHSGTAGIHLALKVLGLKQNQEVIVPTLTFVAAVNPVMYLGAKPVFMDCDDSLNMDITKVERFLEEECTFNGKSMINKSTNREIKGIVIVHVFGNPIDMKRIMKLKEKYGLFILEDATEALGSTIEDMDGSEKYCGTIGDLGVFSFNANKIITTGGGGMVVSHSKEYIDRVRHLSMQAKIDNLFFIHDEIGYNYRISNLHAALGVIQMDYLDEFIKTKIENYNLYQNLIKEIPGLYLMPFNEKTKSNHWFYSIYVDEETFGLDRDSLMEKLNKKGIITRPIWALIHGLPPYSGELSYKIEKAFQYVKRIINVPCSTNLTGDQVKRVVMAIREISEDN